MAQSLVWYINIGARIGVLESIVIEEDSSRAITICPPRLSCFHQNRHANVELIESARPIHLKTPVR